jgi:LacI family transcriptional regulator
MSRFVQSDPKISSNVFVAPREAYVAAMRAAGLEPELVPLTDASRDRAREAAVAHVREHDRPDAFLCRNDDLAIGVYRAMCELGIHVGEDVLLVGCDGVEDTRFMPRAVSTILLPVQKMCERAWQFLERRLAQPEAELQLETLTAKLEIRESSTRGR